MKFIIYVEEKLMLKITKYESGKWNYTIVRLLGFM